MKKVLLTSLSMAVVLAVLAAQAQAATTVAFWKFNKSSGTSVPDADSYVSPGGKNGPYDGTASSSGLWDAPGSDQNPRDGGSNHMDFDGVNQVTFDTYGGTDGTTGGNDWGWATWGPEHTIEFSIFYPQGGFAAQQLNGTGSNNENGSVDLSSIQIYTSNQIRSDTSIKGAFGNRSNYKGIYSDLFFDAAETAGIVQGNTWVDVAFVNADADPNRTKAYINDVDVTSKTVQDIIGGGDTSIIHSLRYFSSIPNNTESTPPIGGTGAPYTAIPGDYMLGARNLLRPLTGANAHGAGRFDEYRISSGIVAFEDLLMQPEPGTLSLMILGGALVLRRKRA